MRIGLIGCGRVGTAIFQLLRRNNKITGVYDIRKKNERTAAKLLKIRKNPGLSDMVSRSDAIFIATPDDDIVNAFANVSRYIKKRIYIFHFSGILTADIIPRAKNIYRASVHPFATFPVMEARPRNQHFFLTAEGDAPALRGARKIFCKQTFTIKKIRKADKPAYHLVGVFSSNLLVGLVTSIASLAEKIGWHHKEFEQLIFPIVEETLQNLQKYGVQDALTGPLARGDIGVIRRHLHSLKNDKTLLSVYKALSRAIVKGFADPKKKRTLTKLLR